MTSPQEEEPETIALYHQINPNDSAFKAAKNVWDLLRDAYMSDEMEANSDNIHLFVEIEGHRNDEGGFTTEMFLVQKQLFANILPAFTSSITMPLGKIEAGEADLETVLQTDIEKAKENPNEEIYQDNLNDLPPEEDFIAEMELVVSYHEQSESLIWGFGDRERTNELTADLAQKEIELES